MQVTFEDRQRAQVWIAARVALNMRISVEEALMNYVGPIVNRLYPPGECYADAQPAVPGLGDHGHAVLSAHPA